MSFKNRELYEDILADAACAEALERQRDDGKRQLECAVDALMALRLTRPTAREIMLARRIKELIEASK